MCYAVFMIAFEIEIWMLVAGAVFLLVLVAIIAASAGLDRQFRGWLKVYKFEPVVPESPFRYGWMGTYKGFTAHIRYYNTGGRNNSTVIVASLLLFDPRTGELRGTPTEADLGESGGIVITVSDGKASAAIGPFRVLINRPANSATPSIGGRAPSISGTPSTTVVAGTGYTFQAVASDPEGNRLTFGARNLPAWLGLNSATGILTGTPTAAQVGTYANITISVTDGTSTVSLPPFTITVTAPAATGSTTGGSAGTTTGAGTGTATLTWLKPMQNADGTPLTDLAGFIVKYGNSLTALDQRIAVNDPAMTRYTVTNLGRGTWYFTVVSYTVGGVESSHSDVVSKTIS